MNCKSFELCPLTLLFNGRRFRAYDARVNGVHHERGYPFRVTKLGYGTIAAYTTAAEAVARATSEEGRAED